MESPPAPIKIIYAEDDEDDQEFFQVALKDSKLNAALTIVPDGHQLLMHLGTNMPDIIFLDINMPVLNGIECLKKIREQDQFENVPVVILSTSSYQVDELFNKGANIFLSKWTFYTDQPSNMLKIFVPGWQIKWIRLRSAVLY